MAGSLAGRRRAVKASGRGRPPQERSPAGLGAPPLPERYTSSVARLAAALPSNAPGDLFIDDRCIGCDTCRRLAPATFGGGEDDQAFVATQPVDEADRRRALMALVSCPVGAIGTRHRADLRSAMAAFPEEVAPGVLQCGFAAESSFGAASWLLLRPDGHVLVDSPRFARPLASRLEALGGVRFLFLTHRDDVADHARWREVLGCERVLHARDLSHGTRDVERIVEGDAPVALAPDLLAVPVPGHTAGSMALLAGEAHLFTGDHLWGDAAGRLDASRAVCWYDWAAQARSMARLSALRFTRVFPGHGRPWSAPTVEAAQAAVAALAGEMRG
jgi:glyoxylase-like metal-dependent hydrolase (beta-lactamase superfamily II)/ferredoxin